MIYLMAIIGYLLLLTGIGYYKSRQVHTQDDFAVAGRSLSPWVMVLTMLAVWIGTGSIVGNAEKAYHTGMAALIIPAGTFLGMIVLSFIANKARRIEVTSVPQIIGDRYGSLARILAVIALIMAYMVIVSYQFNAGGAVLEVITGTKAPVQVALADNFDRNHLVRGRLLYTPEKDWTGETRLTVHKTGTETGEPLVYRIQVVDPSEIEAAKAAAKNQTDIAVIKKNNYARIRFDLPPDTQSSFEVAALPQHGAFDLVEPVLTREKATVIAAVFIIVYTMLAGLMSLAYTDIVTGSIITLSLIIAFPVLLIKAGGFSGMAQAYQLMGDKPHHMQFWGVYKPTELINFLLPTFLLIMGDANQYQRIFASKNAKGAQSAVTTMIFLALAIELLIIASAWIAGSMTPDPENGKYILIYAASQFMPFWLGLIFMVTVVGIIVSTADSFLLIPATTFIKDVYMTHINPKADSKKTLFLSRLMVLILGVIAWGVTFMFAENTGFFRKAMYAYTIYGAAITPSLVAALFWKRATPAGAVSSILGGTLVTLFWQSAGFIRNALPPSLLGLDEVLPAILVSVVLLVGVSLATSNKPQRADNV